jgi:cold shock CspA family protein
MIGTITSVIPDRGFGFIRERGSTAHKETFFHVNDVDDSLLPFDETLVERVVEFEIVDSPKGPRGVAVRAAE